MSADRYLAFKEFIKENKEIEDFASLQAQIRKLFVSADPGFLGQQFTQDSRDHDGYGECQVLSPLVMAIQADAVNIVEALLYLGAPVNGEQFIESRRYADEGVMKAFTPLQVAAESDGSDMVALLLKWQANPLERGVYESKIIMKDIVTGEHSDLTPWRIRNEASRKLILIESFIHELNDYSVSLNDRRLKSGNAEYKKPIIHLSFKGYELFKYEFGQYSISEKQAAVVDVVNYFRNIRKITPELHLDALKQGDLGAIYNRYKKLLPEEFEALEKYLKTPVNLIKLGGKRL